MAAKYDLQLNWESLDRPYGISEKKIFMADDHHQRLIVFRHVPNLDFMTIVSLHVKRILVSPLFHLQSPLFVIRIYYAFGHYLPGLPADTCSFLFIILYLKIVKISLMQLNSKKNFCRFYAQGFYLSMNNNNKKIDYYFMMPMLHA